MSATKFVTLSVAFLMLSLTSFGQKVKYKDLFNLLNAKQYEQAEPFLKKFLRENDETPSAYLYMGFIFQDKAGTRDVLKQTELLVGDLDSAAIFYQKAATAITDKEVRRNEEYYQAYSRRDLRTGKFGIKLSDIQFDLEKRLEAVRDRKEKTLVLKKHFVSFGGHYQAASAQYNEIRGRFSNDREFFLRSDEKLMADLKDLIAVYDSTMEDFNEYLTSSQQYGKTGYNHVLAPVDIRDFKKQEATPVDLYKNNLALLDMKPWAESRLEMIHQEIAPIREQLNTHDAEINKLREKLRKDSISVASDLSKLSGQDLLGRIRKFDPDPFPFRLFRVKTAELEYGSVLAEARPFRDSTSIRQQLRITEAKRKAVSKLDSLSSILLKSDFDEETRNYSSFISDSYGNPGVVRNLAEAMHEFAAREHERLNTAHRILRDRMLWLVDGNDSIPLTIPAAKQVRHTPLVVNDFVTAGFVFRDSVPHGYFYAINPAHTLAAKGKFAVDSVHFQKRQLAVMKTLTARSEDGTHVFLLFFSTERDNGKIPMTAVRISQQKGIQWSHSYAVELIPSSIQYAKDSDELQILAIGPDGNKIHAIDKNGKLVR
ncbi:MAG: hypothetical protein K1X47_14100 [Cyclobacteriaceae bacterium]|nr:hypothetical protein [Cyclobacteriaceae bacterium]